MNIKVSSLYKQLQLPFPEYQTQGSSGMDLYACIEKSLTLQSFERVLIPSGIFFLFLLSIHLTLNSTEFLHKFKLRFELTLIG